MGLRVLFSIKKKRKENGFKYKRYKKKSQLNQLKKDQSSLVVQWVKEDPVMSPQQFWLLLWHGSLACELPYATGTDKKKEKKKKRQILLLPLPPATRLPSPRHYSA